MNSCGNAAGEFMPPFILFNAEQNLCAEWTEDGPPDAGYATSTSGWMEEAQFLKWFKIFII